MYNWKVKFLHWNFVESSVRAIITWVMNFPPKSFEEKVGERALVNSSIWLWVEKRVVRESYPQSQKRLPFQKEGVLRSVKCCAGIDRTMLRRSHRICWLKMGALWSTAPGTGQRGSLLCASPIFSFWL